MRVCRYTQIKRINANFIVTQITQISADFHRGIFQFFRCVLRVLCGFNKSFASCAPFAIKHKIPDLYNIEDVKEFS